MWMSSKRMWVVIAAQGILLLAAVVTVLVIWRQASGEHRELQAAAEAAQRGLREAEATARGAVRALAVHQRQAMDWMTPLATRALARPGTAEAFAMLEAAEAGKGTFNVLRANLLIARGIPECAEIDIAAIDRWYDRLVW